MTSTAEQLQGLFSREQLQQMDAVRQRMLEDPTVLDNHSREVRQETQHQENGNGKVR